MSGVQIVFEHVHIIRDKGCKFLVEPYEFIPGHRLAYLSAPDGVSIELIESKTQ